MTELSPILVDSVISIAGIAEWWSARDYGTARMTDDGGGVISSWVGRINSTTVTAAGPVRPLYNAQAFKGSYPGLIFDGVDDCFVATLFSALPVGTTPGWILVVAEVTPATSGDSPRVLIRYGGDTPGVFRGMHQLQVNKLVIQDGVTLLAESQATFSGPTIVIGTFTGSRIAGRRDGAPISPESVASGILATGQVRLRIGAANAPTAAGFFRGVLSDVIIGTGQPPMTSTALLEGVLAGLPRMSSILPSAHPYSTLTGLAPTVATVWDFPSTGQSNDLGNFSQVVADTDYRSLDPGRAASFRAGARTLGDNQGSEDALAVLPDANISTLVDLRESDAGVSGETISSRMAHRLLAGLDASYGVNVHIHAIAGQLYTSLKKGTVPHSNLLKAVQRLVDIGAETGISILVPAVTIIHGEADHADSADVYAAKLVEWQADLDTDIKAITGQTQTVIVVTDQMSRYNNATSRLGQLKAWIDNPTKFIQVGPKYHLPVVDEVHMTAISVARRGAEFGRAMRAVLITGSTYSPLYITTAVRTGASIVLTFAGNTGTLVFDTTIVTAQADGHYGIEWAQTGGTTRTISSVAITAANQITVTLSGSPGSPTVQQIKIAQNGDASNTDGNAGPVIGPRSNIRDSDTDTETVESVVYPLFKWACHQVIDVA